MIKQLVQYVGIMLVFWTGCAKVFAQENRIISTRIFACSEYTWDKTATTYSASGVYSHLEESDDGEMIEYQLTLTVDNAYRSSRGASACDEYEWHTFTTLGDFEVKEVSVNGAGTIVAIGNGVEGNSNGRVEVYEHAASGWIQLGQTLTGDVGDVFGYSLSLSRSGSVLAVGSPYADDPGEVNVFEYNGEDWVQLGGSISGQSQFELFGWDVDLSNDGTTLIAGAPANGDAEVQTGEAMVFQWDGSNWEQRGGDLWQNTDAGNTNPDNNGSSVAISGDGETVLVGARLAYSSFWRQYFAGTMWKYQWDGSSWELTLEDDGYRFNMGVGRSVALSEDGEVYVAGGDSDRDNAGLALTNRYQGTLTGFEENGRYGRAVSLNQQGNIVAVGSSTSGDGASAAGKVEIFRAGESGWEQMGQDLLGTADNQGFGTALEISGAGNVLVVANSGGDVLGAQVFYYGCAADSPDNCSAAACLGSSTYQKTSACTRYRHLGVDYYQSGIYTQTFESSMGCDSIVTIEATIYTDDPCYSNGNWRNGFPDENDHANLLTDYSTSSYGSIEANTVFIADEATITVEEGHYLKVLSGITNEGGIVLESGATLLTYESASYEGDEIIVKRNTRYADGRYSMLGSPVRQSSEITGALLGEHVYLYDETIPYNAANEGLDNWVFASSAVLIPGRGYTQASRQEIEFEGYPNVGSIEYIGTYTSGDIFYQGLNLVSNPYSAAISVESFLTENENIQGAVYLWDDNGSNAERGSTADYVVANGVAATNTTPAGGQSRYNMALGTAQGFFVRLTGSNNTAIRFTEDMRLDASNDDDSFFRVAETPLVRINLTNEAGLFKQTVIAWKEDGSDDELIKQYDAPVFNEQADNLIYSVKQGEALAIQVRPFTGEEVILGLNISEVGSYQLSMEGDELIFLKDHLTNALIDLRFESYQFEVNTVGQLVDRFSIVSKIEAPLSVDFGEVIVYGEANTIKVLQPENERRTFEIYTINGQNVGKFIFTGKATIDASSLNEGLYLIYDGATIHKILLK